MAPTPGTARLAELLASGRAIWHQCDGADAYAPHAEAHRRGFWTEGHRVIRFVEGHCVYPDGPRIGERVEAMIPWQREAVFEIFELRDDAHRRYRRVLIGVAKKNSKTVLAAWIALYILFDESMRTGQIPCAAASEDQADLVFGAAKTTCELSPTLNALTGGPGKTSTRFEREIIVPTMPGKSLKRVAVGGGNLDGRNIIEVFEDELHEWRTPKSVDTHTVLNRGMILNPDSQSIMITTAGYDLETIEGGFYEYGRRLEAGDVVDATFLFIWYEAPELGSGKYAGTGPYEVAKGEHVDYRSREFFDAANPSAGLTVTYERYLEDIADPRMTEAIARRYHGNQHTEAEEMWLPLPWSAWRAPEPFEIDASRVTVASIDASTNVDSTAITVWDVVGTASELRVRSKSRIWERPIDLNTGRPVGPDAWTLPQAEVSAHLLSLHFGTDVADSTWCRDGVCACGCGKAFAPMHFKSVGFDPARITWGADAWQAVGLPMVKVPQSDQRAVPGFMAFYELLVGMRFEHDGDPVVEQHIKNSTVRWAASGGRRLDRRGGSVRKPNDAASTMWMNAYLLMEPVEEKKPEKAPPVFFSRSMLRRMAAEEAERAAAAVQEAQP